MPFESFLTKTKSKRGMLFHATVAFSVFVHAGALAWATVKSYTEVEELPAPAVKLSFLHAPKLATAAAPPAPKPAKASGGASENRAHQGLRPNLRRRPETPPVPVAAPQPVAQPAEMPTAPEPAAPAVAAAPAAPQGNESGVGGPAGAGAGVGGVGSGAGRGVGNGTGLGGGGAPRMLPEALGKLQRLAGAAPIFPAQLAKQGARFSIMAKVCVGTQGSVDSINLIKGADPLLDSSVTEAVRRWRYRPLMAGETPVPFCTFVRFDFSAIL